MIVYAQSNSKIHIGRAGEHLTTTVVFDISAWLEDFKSSGDFSEYALELVVEQNSLLYVQPITVDLENKRVLWEVTSSNTTQAGLGRCELFYLGKGILTQLVKKPDDWETNWKNYYNSDGVILSYIHGSTPTWDFEDYSTSILYYTYLRPTIKSVIYEIIVTNALGHGENSAPPAYNSWVDKVLDAAAGVEEAKRAVDEVKTEIKGIDIEGIKQSSVKAIEAAERASASEGVAAEAAKQAESSELSASASAKSAEESAQEALDAKKSAEAYATKPPILRRFTGTWWIYAPEGESPNEEGYIDTGEPYGINIREVFNSYKDRDDFTEKYPDELFNGLMVAVKVSNTESSSEETDAAEIFVYTEDGWKYLLLLSGGIGGGSGTSGGDNNNYMDSKRYDPDGYVADVGIPAYVQSKVRKIYWRTWE